MAAEIVNPEEWEAQMTVWRELGLEEGFTLLRVEDIQTVGDFKKLPLFSDSLPVVFDNGARWLTFTGYCSNCGGDVKLENMRGYIYRPAKTHAVMDVVGYCPPCSRISSYKYRLYRDMTISEFKGGQWRNWGVKVTKKSFEEALLAVAVGVILVGWMLGILWTIGR